MEPYRIERNRALARQTEALRGLTFTLLDGGRPEFIVFTTEITSRGDTQITGVCSDPFPDIGQVVFHQGKVYKFDLSQIIFSAPAGELRRVFAGGSREQDQEPVQVL